MLNPFFLQGSQGEQGLVQDLINEQLRMYGLECHYIPRKLLTSRTIMREITESRFDQAFPLEAYLMNVDGYAGQGDILSKFGDTTGDGEVAVLHRTWETVRKDLILRVLYTSNSEKVDKANRD